MFTVYKERTYGSLDFGIKVPNSLIRSLMLNRRRLSTTKENRRRVRGQGFNGGSVSVPSKPKSSVLRLWLSFFCLSFAIALTSASGTNWAGLPIQSNLSPSAEEANRSGAGLWFWGCRTHTYPQGTLQAFDSFQICHRIQTCPACA